MGPAKVKDEIRVLGIDDMPFDKFKDKRTTVIGVMFRGGNYMDGVVSTDVSVDGTDSTKKLSDMINDSKFIKQLQCILLDGIAVGGFNVVDVVELSEKTRLPVIVVMRDYPRVDDMHSALKKIGMEKKIPLLSRAGKIHKVDKVYGGSIHIQCAGIDIEKAKKIIRTTATHSFIPEPIRIAHLVGQGIMLGESRGGA